MARIIMPDLIAQGPGPRDRWRRSLPKGQTFSLGRSTGVWATPWDKRVSRKHATACWSGTQLSIHREATARNPIFVRGEQHDQFQIMPGEHFVIGDTTFVLTDEQACVTTRLPLPSSERTFSPDFLRTLRFRDADARIEVLSRVPEIISAAASDMEMFVRLVNILLDGVSRATHAAMVRVQPVEDSPAGAVSYEGGPVDVLHWDCRSLDQDDFYPSERLIRNAVRERESIVNFWHEHESGVDHATSAASNDWAFCTPVRGEASRGWAFYLAGERASDLPASNLMDERTFEDDVKFTELVAATTASVCDARMWERSHAGLRQFFSPVVVDALVGRDPDEVLRPREAEVSVLFCDLRGFSRRSERSAEDLLGLLQRVSRALGVTTRHILDSGGVVGDFHGDATMGFWGWPLADTDAPMRAIETAIAISNEFHESSTSAGQPLAGFQIGIGIATGNAVAGKIGTVDQVKVTAFGPVVNLAARLEGMTGPMHASILLDQNTVAAVGQADVPHGCRLRRVAIVQPYGFENSCEAFELLSPENTLTDRDIAAYEAALDAFIAGDWADSWKLLQEIQSHDGVKRFLNSFMERSDRIPPSGWNGVISLREK